MDFIFNELCFRNFASDIHSSKSDMSNLLQVCKQGRELGMSKLAIRHDFYEQYLVEDYRIGDWLNDPSVSKISKDLLLGIIRYPYIEDKDNSIVERFISSYAFLTSEEKSSVEGLAVAHLYKTIAISLCSSEEWNTHEIGLKFSEAGNEAQNI